MRLLYALLPLVMTVAPASGLTQDASNQQGETMYKERCASCHDKGVPRAATREHSPALRRMPFVRR
jgi:mono/diheme cytochrome c family protein